MFVPSPCQMTINRRNSCASRIITGSVSGSRKRVPTRLRIATWDIGEDKSFADDLNKKQSIVSSRVALLLRSAEIKLLFHRFVLLWTFLPPPSEFPEGFFGFGHWKWVPKSVWYGMFPEGFCVWSVYIQKWTTSPDDILRVSLRPCIENSPSGVCLGLIWVSWGFLR